MAAWAPWRGVLAERLTARWGQTVTVENATLAAAARARPGALKVRERLDIAQVTYRGLTPVVLATVRGEVQGTLAGVASAREFLMAGALRALAVGRPARLPQSTPLVWFGPAPCSRSAVRSTSR
ncbi:tripartite tricarboxylate transporter substrate-binding protein [Teichococcus oryzae]|uniref:tripartite tricarboxylate transporter substrate-binding protein n=1 Tax=Teichococcus oryzae TaxID=1608942 RepID=UPI0013758C09|nr:tripartite tricarboxylate transporter substrate-binding protein [Pseudoroseomonas oryzae]